MCGIAGFVNSNQRVADRDLIERMTQTLHRRGPDSQGIWTQGPVALGHRRLSIIDVQGGSQPMPNEDETIWVSFNGEIYNEPELREQLLIRGHQFRSQSDTECLVHLYEDHGPDFVRFLNGMFAFAIWDIPRQKLLLSRDRMGQKPLYWHHSDGGEFLFASEPKAILKHPAFSGDFSRERLCEFLYFEYLPFESSIWNGLQKLRPGHSLIFENRMVRIQRYWNPSEPLEVNSAEITDTDKLPEEFWNRFLKSVNRHQRSDVPLGVFLSGGIDSSAVAAALVEIQGSSKVKTFSIGFEDQSFDESEHARNVSKFLGTDHHERIFHLKSLTDILPQLCQWLDEPFGDASVLPTFLLSQFAREHVTVALGGDGADELLAGYPTFSAEPWLLRFQKLPRFAQQMVGQLVSHLPVRHTNFSFDFKARQFLKGAGASPCLSHQRWLGSFSEAEIQKLITFDRCPSIEMNFVKQLEKEWSLGMSEQDKRLIQYQTTYLPEDILFKVDRASMATSLEVRAPFLDTELVDWLAKQPYSAKREGGQGKQILKKALQRRIPDSILKRPKKGFGIPVAAWLRGPLKGWMTDLLAADRLNQQGLFLPSYVAQMIDQHLKGQVDYRKPLWTLLIFQIWYDYWINGNSHTH